MPSNNSESSSDEAKLRLNRCGKKIKTGPRKTKYRERRLKLRWTDEQTELLIREIESREPLWNDKNILYVDRSHRDQLWQEVAEKLQMDTSEIKNKWNCLRNAFRMSFRTRKSCAIGSIETTTPRFRKFHMSLLFLEPSMSNDTIPKRPKSFYHFDTEYENESAISQEMKLNRTSQQELMNREERITSMDENLLNNPLCNHPKLNHPESMSMSSNHGNDNDEDEEDDDDDDDDGDDDDGGDGDDASFSKSIHPNNKIQVNSKTVIDDDWEVIGKFVAMNGRKWRHSNPIIESNFRASLYALIADLEQESVIN